MRKLILKMSTSIDGFVGGPNGEIDWLLRTTDAEATAWILDTLSQAGVHIMGSRTYYDMAAYWPYSDEPFAAPMNEIPKLVFSARPSLAPLNAAMTTRAIEDARHANPEAIIGPSAATSNAEAQWRNPALAHGDLAEEIAHLKARPGKDIIAHGGASFAQSLTALGLIDEYQLIVHPVALGRGLPLFSALAAPLDLDLIATTRFASGAVAHVYRPR
jgi:dihydrofolate reductase